MSYETDFIVSKHFFKISGCWGITSLSRGDFGIELFYDKENLVRQPYEGTLFSNNKVEDIISIIFTIT